MPCLTGNRLPKGSKIRVPRTWNEISQVAERSNGKVFDGQKVSGFVARGDKTRPSMTSGFGTCFDSMGGLTWKTTINSPQGVKAAELWKKLMSKYAPEGVSSYTWYEAMQAFMKGSVAMFVDADHMAGSFEDPKESSVVGSGRIRCAAFKDGYSTKENIWIWSIAMAADSKNKPAAWLFLQWASSKDLLVRSTLQNNINPCRVVCGQ